VKVNKKSSEFNPFSMLNVDKQKTVTKGHCKAHQADEYLEGERKSERTHISPRLSCMSREKWEEKTRREQSGAKSLLSVIMMMQRLTIHSQHVDAITLMEY
jgi:hypothetical protein